MLELAERHRIWVLFGSPAFRQATNGGLEELNRAYLVSPEGREVGTYDKIQLVPFGVRDLIQLPIERFEAFRLVVDGNDEGEIHSGGAVGRT